ncbi:MAG: hypothetical protein ACFFCP_17435 [Promethearchaeota archaeon]
MKKWKSVVTLFSIVLILVLLVTNLNFDNGSVISAEVVDSPAAKAGVTNGQTYLNVTYDSFVNSLGGEVVIELDDGGFMIGATLNFDFGLVRVDSNGNYLWNKTYDDTKTNRLEHLIKCSDGGFALLGTTYNWPEPGTYSDMWLVRTNSSGDMLWNATYAGPWNDETAGIIELEDGFMLAGSYHVTNDPNKDFWLIRTNETGDVEWSKMFGDLGTQICEDIIQTSDNGYALCGRDVSDIWLVKTDSQGNHVWNKTWGGVETEYAYGIIECELGGFAIAGKSGDSMLLLRTDSNGNYLWNATFLKTDFENVAYTLVETSDHGFTLLGECILSLPEFALSNYHELSMQEGIGTVWLLQTDSTGDVVWQHFLGKDGDGSRFLATVEDGGYLITGSTEGHIFLWIIPELNWIQTPTDQVITVDSQLTYQLEAASIAAPLIWEVDNSSFLTDANGVLRNATHLEVGIYELSITVIDAVDNTLTADISVTVNSDSTTTTTTTGGDQTLLILAVAGIGGGVGVILLFVIVKKRGG